MAGEARTSRTEGWDATTSAGDGESLCAVNAPRCAVLC